VVQLSSLERKTSSQGKDKIDHGPGGHDDAANVACGCMVLATAYKEPELAIVQPIIVSQNMPPEPDTDTTQAYLAYAGRTTWWGPV
jgi:hypothetical protein